MMKKLFVSLSNTAAGLDHQMCRKLEFVVMAYTISLLIALPINWVITHFHLYLFHLSDAWAVRLFCAYIIVGALLIPCAEIMLAGMAKENSFYNRIIEYVRTQPRTCDEIVFALQRDNVPEPLAQSLIETLVEKKALVVCEDGRVRPFSR